MRAFIALAIFAITVSSNASSTGCSEALAELDINALPKINSESIDFSIPQSQIEAARKQINREIINTSLFVIPSNDGEALRATEILSAIEAPYLHLSKQAWGATLDKEVLDPALLKKVKRVVVFEIPGLEVEQKLRDQGLEVVVIDHHTYKDVDRHRDEGSLEQLAALINWPMSQTDQIIAVNDRGYIPGLKKMGLSRQLIREVRQYDLLAQGYGLHRFEKSMALFNRLLQRILSSRRGGVYVLKNIPVDVTIVRQELAIQSETGVVSTLEIGHGRIGFSGNPRIVKRLLAMKFEDLGYDSKSFAQYGGGDPQASMFFGFKPTTPPKGEVSLIPSRVEDKILEEISLATQEGVAGTQNQTN